MSAALRVGLVGAGRLAEVGYVPAAGAAHGVALCAVADPDPGRRAAVAGAAGGLPAFADAATLLTETGPDALVLASPVAAHLPDARLAAAAGVAVLVEKPPAPDAVQAAQLAALTPAPWVGFNRRFDPAVAALRALVAATLPAGAAVDVRVELTYRRSGWAAHTVTDDVLLDVGPHLIDLARRFGGAEVTGVRGATVSPTRAGFELRVGAGRARVRCAADRPHRELVEVRTASGEVLGRHRVGGLVSGVRRRLMPTTLAGRRAPHPLVASLTAQLEAFARAARGHPESDLGTAADGAAVMTVVDAVRAAAAARAGPVPVRMEE